MDKTDLDLVGLPTDISQKMRNAGFFQRDMREAAHEARALVTGCRWDWPAEHRWRSRFRELGVFPYMWCDLEEDPPEKSQEWIAYEEGLQVLSMSARSLSLRRLWPMPLNEVETRSGLPPNTVAGVLRELTAAGWASESRELKDRLSVFALAELKAVQKERGLKGGRSKDDTIGRLLAEVAETELLAALPRRIPECIFVFHEIPSAAQEYESYVRGRLSLYLHFAWFCLTAEANYHQWKELESLGGEKSRIEVLRPGDDDPCPICKARSSKRFPLRSVRVDDLSPCHPGCRCIEVIT